MILFLFLLLGSLSAILFLQTFLAACSYFKSPNSVAPLCLCTCYIHIALNVFLFFDRLLKAFSSFKTKLRSHCLLNAYLILLKHGQTCTPLCSCYTCLVTSVILSLQYWCYLFVSLSPNWIVNSLWARTMLYISLCFHSLYSNWYVVDI